MTTRGLLLALTAAGALAVAVVLAGSPPGVAASQPVDAPGRPGDVEAGEQVFQANCAMCHGADASGMMGMHPSLRGAIDRLSREGVEVAIREGRRTETPMRHGKAVSPMTRSTASSPISRPFPTVPGTSVPAMPTG